MAFDIPNYSRVSTRNCLWNVSDTKQKAVKSEFANKIFDFRCQSVQNFGLAIVSMVSGMIVDTWGYYWLEVFFIGSLSFSLLATFVVWILDNRAFGIMNMTPYEREVHACNRQ